MIRLFVLACFLLSAAASAQPPIPAFAPSRTLPAGMEGLMWHKWETDHFAVISLNKSAGGSLRSGIEQSRLSALSLWGVDPADRFFCKLVCVQDPEMLLRLFGLKEPRCEVRRSSSGDVNLVAIWIDESRMSKLPSLLVEAEVQNGNFPAFAKKGLSVLSCPPDKVRDVLAKSAEVPCSSMLDDKKSAELLKSNPSALDSNYALLCLMIRKEYGARAFSKAISSPPSSLAERLGFKSASQLDATLTRYRANLLKDMADGRTPDQYLTVLP